MCRTDNYSGLLLHACLLACLLQNVDLALAPIRTPSGDGVASCSVTLMPWSPFPCTYSTEAFKGVEGQNKTSWCYSKHSKSAAAAYDNARDLTTDGYTNLFHGALPDTPCGDGSTGSSRTAASGRQQQAGSGSNSRPATPAPAAARPGYSHKFTRVLLTVNFRVAAGRQFDRTFAFQIGRVVVSVCRVVQVLTSTAGA